MNAFVEVARGMGKAMVRRGVEETVTKALFYGTDCVQVERGGRCTVQRFPLEGGKGLVRRYRRGGAMQRLVKDHYVLVNRPLRELKLHDYLFRKGLAVPEPLGAVWERHGILYRGAIATREIPGPNLLEYLQDTRGSLRGTMENAGKLIRQMHDLGVYHADLQLRNIVVGEDGTLYLIDFDKSTRVRELPALQRYRNLLRLRRSMQKNGVPLTLFEPLRERYGNTFLPKWLDRVYCAKGRVSDAASRRSHDTNGSS